MEKKNGEVKTDDGRANEDKRNSYWKSRDRRRQSDSDPVDVQHEDRGC